MSKDPKGYYKELGVRFDADDKEIKQHYRDEAKKWHPDYNSSEEALEKFQNLSVAYDVIRDQRTRLMYDLLSEVYEADKFPDMFALKSYKSRSGEADIYIRALTLKKRGVETKEIVSEKEAAWVVFKNFITNFWNIKDVIYNFKNLDKNYSDNFALLVHNMLAYEQEGEHEKAYVCAEQALYFAENNYQKKLLKIFISQFGVERSALPRFWNYRKLRLIQMSIPLTLIALMIIPNFSKVVSEIEIGAKKTMSYYQEVQFNSGGRTVDDLVVSKIMSIPVDTEDMNRLYHTTKRVAVKFGPSHNFDTILALSSGHTVRVTGFTPDKKWYRVMLDNGDMGFVESEFLQKGMKNEIPETSKIYTGFRPN